MPAPTRRARLLATSGLALSALALTTMAPRLAAAAVGDSDVASIEPPTIPHPSTTPCTVTLLSGAAFGASAVPYNYAPPAACPGPWAKVVLSVDISVQAGRQYDRTGTLWLGGVNLWFGTTAEPRSKLAPSWHVERDVTDDTALLETPATGHMLIANYQNSTYTSTITAGATLAFYPASAASPVPRTPDVILPFASNAGGDTVALNDGAATLSRTLVLPRNIERAVFDATLQSQYDDEFWYTCVPDADADALGSCGGGAFREGALSIDGQPAGVAPVYPVIFTGGIDPLLWEPVPGPTTLDLRPFRMELTPFAGTLDRAGTHTIALSVPGANDFFSVTGTLYLYLDHGAATDTGSLLRDTLGAPAPAVTETQSTTGGTLTADVATASTHGYALSGVLSTSHGTVSTTVAQTSAFSNRQHFVITDSAYTQDIRQDTETDQTVTTAGPGVTGTVRRHFSFPLALDIVETGTDTDVTPQTTQAVEGLLVSTLDPGAPVPASLLAEGIASKDTIQFLYNPATGSYSLGANSGAGSAAFYTAIGAQGCVGRVLASSNNVLTAERQASGCAEAAAIGAMAAGVGAH